MTNTKVPIRIPWSPPLLEEDDKQAAIQVIQSGWMTQGKQTAAFESEIEQACGAKHAVVVNNGTSALIVALLLHGIGPGDEALVPTMTFIATVNAVLAVGAKPVLVDCDPATLNLTPELLRSKLTSRTKAVIFVDVYGMPCDIDSLRSFSAEHQLILIEDAAEAIGARYKGKTIGSFDHTTIISFHMAKLTPTVEGGCLLTQNDELATRMKRIRNHGMDGPYHYVCFGLNFRITDIQSAIGRSQLAKLPRIIEHRQALVRRYKDGLRGLVEFQSEPSFVTAHPYMIFAIFLPDRAIRDRVNIYLNSQGIDTRICWVPAHLQPYHKRLFATQERFPNADLLAGRTLSLPLGNALSSAEVDTVVDAVKQALSAS